MTTAEILARKNARIAAKKAQARKDAAAFRADERDANISAAKAAVEDRKGTVTSVTPRATETPKPWDHLGVGSFATRF